MSDNSQILKSSKIEQNSQQVSGNTGFRVFKIPLTSFTIDTLTSDKVAKDERQLLRQEFIRKRAEEFKRKVNELPDIPGTFEDDIKEKENPAD